MVLMWKILELKGWIPMRLGVIGRLIANSLSLTPIYWNSINDLEESEKTVFGQSLAINPLLIKKTELKTDN